MKFCPLKLVASAEIYKSYASHQGVLEKQF